MLKFCNSIFVHDSSDEWIKLEFFFKNQEPRLKLYSSWFLALDFINFVEQFLTFIPSETKSVGKEWFMFERSCSFMT
jgi:hypothetical protein